MINPQLAMETLNEPTLLPIRTSGEMPMIASIDFAAGLDIQHKNLLETIRTHRVTIEANFGAIAFESEYTRLEDSAFQTRNLNQAKRITKPQTVAYLSKDQALFIGSLSRNSEKVVEFKALLVRSFAKAEQTLRQLTTTPVAAPVALPDNNTLLLQLMNQQQNMMSVQQEMLQQLRADVEEIKAGKKPVGSRKASRPALSPPHLRELPQPPAPVSSARQSISRRVNEYCGIHNVSQSETYNYLYKRLYDVYGINVYRLQRGSHESFLDALERYNHLDRLYGLIAAELIAVDSEGENSFLP